MDTCISPEIVVVDGWTLEGVNGYVRGLEVAKKT